MMNLFKLYGKLMDALPLLGAVGSLLAVGAAILGRAAACHGMVCLGSALQPTALEMAAASAAVAGPAKIDRSASRSRSGGDSSSTDHGGSSRGAASG